MIRSQLIPPGSSSNERESSPTAWCSGVDCWAKGFRATCAAVAAFREAANTIDSHSQVLKGVAASVKPPKQTKYIQHHHWLAGSAVTACQKLRCVDVTGTRAKHMAMYFRTRASQRTAFPCNIACTLSSRKLFVVLWAAVDGDGCRRLRIGRL
jgi:hypothetical protein